MRASASSRSAAIDTAPHRRPTCGPGRSSGSTRLVDLREREVLERHRRRRRADRGSAIRTSPKRPSGALARGAQAHGAWRSRRARTSVINGNEISWGNWRFHARLDPRVGTVISRRALAGRDHGSRSVLYQGYLSEMFVPYMDADYGWHSRTYFDTGEYGAGVLATPLKRGVDCPATAAFLPATFGDDKGEPITTPNALCVFERRHSAIRSGGTPSRQPDLRRPRQRRAGGAHGGRPSATTTTCSTGCSTTPPRSRCASAPPASTR